MNDLTHVVDRVTLVKKEEYGVNVRRLVAEDEDTDEDIFVSLEDDENKPKRRGRPPKKRKEEDENTFAPQQPKNPINSDMPYESTYVDNSNALKNTVGQIDYVNNAILHDLEVVRALRDKRKWEYIGGLASTTTSLLGNKISAIREMNNIITKCHDLEFKRAKELKFGVDDGDDDKKMMDLYNAYINTPVGAIGSMPFSTMTPGEMMTTGNGVAINAASQAVRDDGGYNAYLANCTPEQNAMYMEQNPYVKTVLVYDQTSQERHFEVLNLQTGENVPNMPIPSDAELEGVVVDLARGTARNASLHKNYELKIIGERGMNEY